jgi:FKBP-type peptidyl-prolyl cis-trans isomerase SlyD
MKIAENCVVSMEYTVKDVASNEVVDSNVGKAPLTFITSKMQIIPGLEESIMGLEPMSATEAPKEILVTPENAYGEFNEEACQKLPKEQFAGIELEKGMTLYGSSEDGQTIQVTVQDFDDNEVTIDYNHPLAGKTLMFAVTILEVREATNDEVITGMVGGASGCCGGGCGDHGHEHKEESGSCGTGGCGCH